MKTRDEIASTFDDVTIEETLNRQQLRYIDRQAPLYVRPDESVKATVGMMREHHADNILVCDGESLLGIFTDRDYLDKVAGQKVSLDTPISKLMTARPVTLTLDHTVADLIRAIVKDGFRHLPVLNEKGSVVGVYTARSIVRYIAETFPTEVLNLPAGPGRILSDAEGA